MILLALLLTAGFVLAAFGATAGGALVTTSRAELTRFVAARLRGKGDVPQALVEADSLLAAATSTTALGVLLLGAAVPALVAGVGVLASIAGLVILAVPVILVSGYFLPRWLSLPRAAAVSRFVLPVLRPWARVLAPLLPAAGGGSQRSLRALKREGGAVDTEAAEELSLVGGVMDFAQRPVRTVMTPRTDIVAIPEDATVPEIAEVFAQSGYSRIPVYRGTLDEIVGMLHAFDLFKLGPNDPLPLRPVAVAPASRSCGDVLLDMQRERRLMAVVLDEYGGTLGVVTLDNLLEAIVGEIADEDDATSGSTGGGGLLETDGGTPKQAVEEHFAVSLPKAHAGSIGGVLVELAGRIPAAGERFQVAGLELDVLQSSPTRVERLLIRQAAPAPIQLQERNA